MIAIYCRQSVDKKDSISIEQQEQECKRLISDTDKCKVYSDKGYTGANTNRPQFEKLINDIKNMKIEKVVVYKVDRISRSLQDFVAIYNEFEKYNVKFISCNEQFDTSTAMGKATLQIIMVFAELERNMTQKRVKDNFYERAKKGLFLAGVAPYGFRKKPIIVGEIHTHMLEIDDGHPEKIQAVKMIYDEYLLNKSLGMVAKKMNDRGYRSNRGNYFTSVSISRILRNPVYVMADADVYRYLKNKGAIMNQPIEDYIGIYGCTIYGTRKNKTTKKFTNLTGEYVQMNQHKGIIDSKEWLAIQYELDKNKPISNSGKGKNTWLTGLTKCGFCGKHISVVNGQRNGKRYMNCGGRKANFCFERTITMSFDEIEEIVQQGLLQYIKDFQFIKLEKEKSKIQEENELKIQLLKIEDEIENLLSKIQNANKTLFKYINEHIEKLDVEKEKIQKKINEKKSNSVEIIDPELVSRVLSEWEDFSFEEKKFIAHMFIEKIIIYNGKLDIIYK